jgi:hypothetical protein
MRALLRVLGVSLLLALLVIGVLAAAAVGAIPREAAAVAGLVVLVAGGVLVGRTFARGLVTRDGGDRPDAGPDPAPDRGRG